MISFEHRILSEYRIKIAKIDPLVKSIFTHRNLNDDEARGASDFLDVLINESDYFMKNMVIFYSIMGKDLTLILDCRKTNNGMRM